MPALHNETNRNGIPVAFCILWAVTLCRCSQHGVIWGRLGSTGVEIGGRGRGRLNEDQQRAARSKQNA